MVAADQLISDGYKARAEGRPKDAKASFIEAVTMCRLVGDQVRLARSLTGVGQIERDLGNDELALLHYQESVSVYRALDEPDRLAHTVRHVADILRHEGCVEEARVCYQEALAIYRGRGETSPLDLANAVRGFALLNEDAGDVKLAKELWVEAGTLYESLGLEVGVKESESRLHMLEGLGM